MVDQTQNPLATEMDQSMGLVEMSRLTFGIYAGSATGDGEYMLHGPTDNLDRANRALDQLQGANRPFIVRAYEWYIGGGRRKNLTPVQVEGYAIHGRQLDFVLCYQDATGDLEGWLEVIRHTIRQYGPALAILQIAEEPNNPDPAKGGDGSSPLVHEAIIQGVPAAKAEARKQGYAIQIGFNATPSLAPADTFWPRLGELATPSFLEALDYVGLDFFPDVFRRLAPDGTPGDLYSAVPAVLKSLREVHLPNGRIPSSVPIHIAENGWATGADRSYERQAAVLDAIVRIVYRQSRALNITHYELFALRDADSTNPDLFHQFGLLRDDYTPKPAFETYRHLIAELGAPA